MTTYLLTIPLGGPGLAIARVDPINQIDAARSRSSDMRRVDPLDIDTVGIVRLIRKPTGSCTYALSPSRSTAVALRGFRPVSHLLFSGRGCGILFG